MTFSLERAYTPGQRTFRTDMDMIAETQIYSIRRWRVWDSRTRIPTARFSLWIPPFSNFRRIYYSSPTISSDGTRRLRLSLLSHGSKPIATGGLAPVRERWLGYRRTSTMKKTRHLEWWRI